MYPPITKVQLVSFVLNRLRKKERKNIIEAINTNAEIKEWYLLEKRKTNQDDSWRDISDKKGKHHKNLIPFYLDN